MVGPKQALNAARETVNEVTEAAESTVRDATSEAERRVHDLGAFIREQRETAKLSGRNLAKRAGVSNPYLSQIERGLRKPSAEILQSIAKALRISAETLYVKAGILEERDSDVVAAIVADSRLQERHKRSLLDIYRSFISESGVMSDASDDNTGDAALNAPANADPSGTT